MNNYLCNKKKGKQVILLKIKIIKKRIIHLTIKVFLEIILCNKKIEILIQI